MCSWYICPLLFHILQLNLKSYIDLLLIWGAIYPKDNSPGKGGHAADGGGHAADW